MLHIVTYCYILLNVRILKTSQGTIHHYLSLAYTFVFPHVWHEYDTWIKYDQITAVSHIHLHASTELPTHWNKMSGPGALEQLCSGQIPFASNRNSSRARGEIVNNALVQHVQCPSWSRLKLTVSIITVSPLATLPVSLFLKQHYVCGMCAACLCLLRKSHSCALRASPVSFKH